MKRLIFGLTLVLSLFAAAAAMGESYYCDDGSTDCGFDGDSTEFESWNAGGWVGGNYIQCTAKGSTQFCYEVAEVYKPATNTWVRACTRVQHAASCQCNTSTLEAKGYCQWFR